MVEPLFHSGFAAAPKVGDIVELGGSEGKHAASVRRMRAGEAIQLTDGRGTRVRGSVAEVLPKSLTVSVSEVSAEELPDLQLVLIQALAKGDRDELAIQAATELGATGIYPWQAERSISRWDVTKAAKGEARWQVICDEAAKQSLRSHFPKVESIVDSNKLASLIASFDAVLVLDPTAKAGLGSLGKLRGKVALVVGPEGGIDDTELEQFAKAGAKLVHLGESILRTSTAGVAAIAAIQALAGDYN